LVNVRHEDERASSRSTTVRDICSCPYIIEKLDTFDAIGDPSRRRLLDLLMRSPCPVGELAAAAELSQPNASRHLRILRDAGLVESRVDGQRRVYALRAEGFAEAARWLAPYVVLWQGG
jgi:DNA-binding transcriptional ArsR family regulator